MLTLVVTGLELGDGVGDGVSAAGRNPPVTAAPLLDACGDAEALGAIETVELATGAGFVDGAADPDGDGDTLGFACGLP